MKRKSLLRIGLGVALAMFVVNGLFAQVQNADYALYDANEAAPTAIDSVTTGTTTGFYVMPDMYYHPDYTAVGGWTLTADFTWNWSFPGANGGSTINDADPNDNYVEIDWGAVSGGTPYEVNVYEEAPVAYGGCSGDITVLNVEVVAAPTVTFSADFPGSIIGADLTVCEGDARLADIVQAAFTGIRTFQLDWDLEIATLDASMAKDEYFDIDYNSLGAVQAYAIQNQGSDGSQTTGINATTYDLTVPTGGFLVQNSKSTVFTYDIRGVNDRISRKSDYLTNAAAALDAWSWYDTGVVETIVITVNPAPDTGPIYHIPNDWNP
jgi:hypothetical protein